MAETYGSERYYIAELANSAVLVHDRTSGLSGLWHKDGQPMHGDLTYGISRARIGRLVREAYGK